MKKTVAFLMVIAMLLISVSAMASGCRYDGNG